MSCTIEATAGHVSANAYITVADADIYFSERLHTDTWDDADAEDKCKALKWATKLLDQWYEWNGSTADSDQALLWPRVGVTGPNGYLEASDAIPTRIAEATAELAMSLIANNRTVDSDVETQGITQVTAGDVAVSFSGAGSAKVIPDAVASMVSVYGTKRSSSGGSVTLRRA